MLNAGPAPSKVTAPSLRLDPPICTFSFRNTPGDPCALEDADFPIGELSDLAEVESWRKEVHRPIYHLHKWWAQRLGSVFRAILIGAAVPAGTDILPLLSQPLRFPSVLVFDPFMGGGTTVGEALKLGCTVIGRDVNPVACFTVKVSMAPYDRAAVIRGYRSLERRVGRQVAALYECPEPGGRSVTVLYYFWVTVLSCPQCEQFVDLFKSYVFARHAYPRRYPDAQIICPSCGAIVADRYDSTHATCRACGRAFNPQSGPVSGAYAQCTHCDRRFSIVSRLRALGRPPVHRMYAKLVLMPDGAKAYRATDDQDLELYEHARAHLRRLAPELPSSPIEPGYNTNQIINYQYHSWHELFNDRQLLAITLLSQAIQEISEPDIRDLFACLLSGALEFNNMFASYKGEGTGAVRHMFSHHILKPERCPLEANLWGTPKSSGSFSTLFARRVLRALDYKDRPLDLTYTSNTVRRVSDLSEPIAWHSARSYADLDSKRLYLSCGDSSHTDVPDGVVDLVVTDPPFFDNVHYSQLADFFYVWQRQILGECDWFARASSRDAREVQNEDPNVFAERLCSVWRECFRVLTPNGLLIFTYHHSRPAGWSAVLSAVVAAQFVVTACHPIKAEMSVAAPKHQAKEPIDLDIVFVCRKRTAGWVEAVGNVDIVEEARGAACLQMGRLTRGKRCLSRNDVRVILMAQIVRILSSRDAAWATGWVDRHEARLGHVIDELCALSQSGHGSERSKSSVNRPRG